MFLRRILCGLLIAMSMTGPAFAADHTDAPLARTNPKLDITDIYAFRNPSDAGRLVIMLNVFTPVGLPDDARLFSTSDEGEYAVFIDTDGDVSADHTIRILFSSDNGAAQEFSVRGIPESATLEGLVSTQDGNGQVATDGSALVYAGLRDDPFFFDSEAFNAFLAAPCVPSAGLRCPGTGSPRNFFGDFNTAAIVIEFPVTALRGIDSADSGTIGVWAKTFTK